MQQTFRADKSFLRLELFVIAFCLALWMGISWAILSHDESPSRWTGVAFFGCLLGGLAVLICYAFVRDWRAFLTFDGDLIVQQGIVRRLEFKLSEVVEVA